MWVSPEFSHPALPYLSYVNYNFEHNLGRKPTRLATVVTDYAGGGTRFTNLDYDSYPNVKTGHWCQSCDENNLSVNIHHVALNDASLMKVIIIAD